MSVTDSTTVYETVRSMGSTPLLDALRRIHGRDISSDEDDLATGSKSGI